MAFFDDIALAADWYTGDCVFEAPGEHKVTDLEWCEAQIARKTNGDVMAFARIETPKGPIEKSLRFRRGRAAGRIRSRLRLGRLGQRRACGWAISPCLPDAFDQPSF